MKNVPKLRFNGFSDEWEEIRLGDYLVKSTEVATEHSNIPVLTSSRRGLFLQTEYFNKEISAKDTTGYNVIRKGYFTYRHMSDDSTFYFNINNKWDIALVSPEYPVFKTNEYLSQYILQQHLNSSKAFEKFCKMQKKGGTRTRLYYKVLQDYTMKIPSCEEQEKIANFLTKVDKLIEKQDEKVKNIEKYKKGMMQKIFSQEIRFKDENGKEYPEWEEKKLEQCFLERVEKNKPDLELLSVSISDGVKKRSEIESKDNSSDDKSNYKLVEQNDIVYNSMRMWQGASGVSEYKGIVSPAYTVLIPLDNVNSIYFSYLFKLENTINKFRKFSQGLTSDTWNLKYPLLKDIKVIVPCLNEQDKIARFLTRISLIIEEENNKLEELKQWKKGLLQQMFV